MNAEPQAPQKVEVDMANSIDFEDPDEKTHNVVLVVQEKKYYCVKATLAKHAEYFEKLFFSPTTPENQQEFLLEGPSSPEEFQVFLEITHGLKTLTDENVIGVLELSSFWSAKVAKVRCIKYIASKRCKFSLKNKFQVACQHQSAEFIQFLLDGIDNAAELNTLLTPNVFNLPQPLLGMIYKKCREVPGRWTESPDLIVDAIVPAAEEHEPPNPPTPAERALQARLRRMTHAEHALWVRQQEEREQDQIMRRRRIRRGPY